MAKIKVIWSRTAYLQRKIILLFWVENNKSTTYSKKLVVEIKKATTQLSKFPNLGKPTDIKSVYCYVMGIYNLYYNPFGAINKKKFKSVFLNKNKCQLKFNCQSEPSLC